MIENSKKPIPVLVSGALGRMGSEELNAIHAGVRASQGSFSLPFDGWHYKNGEKCSIESATVAGDIKYLLKNIVNIENEEELTTSGISPHVWINELSITGDE